MKTPIDLYPGLKSLMRLLVGAGLSTDVVLVPGDRAATLEGHRGVSKTWKWKTSYTHSTLHVLVGITWATKVWLRLKTPPAGLKLRIKHGSLYVTSKRLTYWISIDDSLLIHRDYRRRIKRAMAVAIAKTKPNPSTESVLNTERTNETAA